MLLLALSGKFYWFTSDTLTKAIVASVDVPVAVALSLYGFSTNVAMWNSTELVLAPTTEMRS